MTLLDLRHTFLRARARGIEQFSEMGGWLGAGQRDSSRLRLVERVQWLISCGLLDRENRTWGGCDVVEMVEKVPRWPLGLRSVVYSPGLRRKDNLP